MSFDAKENSSRLSSVFARSDFMQSAPKTDFPKDESHPEDILQLISDELLLDGLARKNLATFCQTWAEPQIHKLMDICIAKNIIDKDEYPQSAELEKRCVRMLADLWRAPEPDDAVGASTVGSSEACMLAGMAMKWRWRARRKAQNKSIDRPNLVCGPVQVCWHKFCRYWDIEIRETPMEAGRYVMTPEDMLKSVDENTIGVVATLGLTFTGEYEPIHSLCAALDDLERREGLSIDMHVDGASGGFIAPFCAPDLVWDFRSPRVKSISTSGHKFGLAPLGVGWILWRERADLPDDLVFHVNYLGGDMPTIAINFSRPAGQVVSQYYNFLRLGREGYKRAHMACYATARRLAEAIVELGPFEIINSGDPQKGIPAVSWRIQEGAEPGYSLFDLADRLRTGGWQIPAYKLPPNADSIVVQRILVRQDVSADLASLALRDIKKAIEHLQKHPVTSPLSQQEAGGFSYS